MQLLENIGGITLLTRNANKKGKIEITLSFFVDLY